MNKTLLTAFLSGCTTTAIAGLLIILPGNPKDTLPEPRVYIAECDNLHALNRIFWREEAARYALMRLKQQCENQQEEAVLLQIWERDPGAGAISE